MTGMDGFADSFLSEETGNVEERPGESIGAASPDGPSLRRENMVVKEDDGVVGMVGDVAVALGGGDGRGE